MKKLLRFLALGFTPLSPFRQSARAIACIALSRLACLVAAAIVTFLLLALFRVAASGDIVITSTDSGPVRYDRHVP